MKTQILAVSKVLNFLVILLMTTSFSYNKAEISLKVNVAGIQSAQGNVHVLLFNNATGFPANPDKAYKHAKAKAIKGEMSVQIEKVPFGTYSIVAFHDINANEQFDKSWFGSPQEDYGFSNLPGEYCGTPSFKQTSFNVNQQSNNVSIKLMNVR